MLKFATAAICAAFVVKALGEPGSRADHWAFQPVREVRAPVDPTGWPANPIDRFVSEGLREHGLRLSPKAERRTLARRLFFDLIGLPPTPSELRSFLEDESREAVSTLADRLLASPRFGERWGRYWMDVVRYADTAGDNADYPVPEARLYRDYIIDSLNADKPYDQFVRQQLAGDILADQRAEGSLAEQRIATGFLALSRRYGTGPGELWHLVLEDTIETTGRAFMGMTFRCARCHDHKFDPVTQEDYYAMYGIFSSTRFPWAGSEEVESKKLTRLDFVPLLPDSDVCSRREAYERRINELKAEVEAIEENDPVVMAIAALTNRVHTLSNRVVALRKEGFELPSLRTQLAALNKQVEDEKKKLRDKLRPIRTELRGLEIPGIPPGVPAAYAVREDKAADANVQIHGEPSQPGAVVPRGAPRFLVGDRQLKIPEGASGRLEFADWIANANHPLTARVMVNRIWQHYFGRGIVATPSNFGLNGEPPSHPELLDWLAGYFIKSDWSMKAVHRLIVTSKTYQLSSAGNPDNEEIDPENRWCWRHNRRRLDAEAIRDAMLAVSGGLDATVPGLHPFPPFEKWNWTQHNPFKEDYETSHRSVYLMTQRFKKHAYLGLFDGPDANLTTDVRTVSTVPPQALFMMNNSFVVERAEGLATRVLTASSDDSRRVQLAGELAWSRPVRGLERQKALEYIRKVHNELERTGLTGRNAELQSWTAYAKILLMANEFLYVD